MLVRLLFLSYIITIVASYFTQNEYIPKLLIIYNCIFLALLGTMIICTGVVLKSGINLLFHNRLSAIRFLNRAKSPASKWFKNVFFSIGILFCALTDNGLTLVLLMGLYLAGSLFVISVDLMTEV